MLAIEITQPGGITIGELVFIGMGLGSEEGMSLQALNTLKQADLVFFETYTGLSDDTTMERVEKLTGKKVIASDRAMVEDGSKILEAASDHDSVALLVVGDAMSATTHIDLRLRAIDAGISTRVIEGSSIFTAAPGMCGLSHYKFGRTTTLAFPQGNYFPESPYDMIGANIQGGLHSLVLLEFTVEEGRIMTANDGMKILMELEGKKKMSYITDDMLICVVARAGSEDALVRAGWLKDMTNEDFGEPMHCLIIPGKLHFKEAEALVKLSGGPPEIMDSVD
jgi:diphthine synthase